MVERVTDPWRASDGKTFASRAEAEKHEGAQELVRWIQTAIADAIGLDDEGREDVASRIIAQIQRSPDHFVSLLRKAGVPLRERPKARPPSDLPADFGNDAPKSSSESKKGR